MWHTVHKNQEIKLEIGKEFPGTPLEGHFGVVRRQDIISGLAKAVYDNPNITVRTKHKAVKLIQNEKEATVQVLTISYNTICPYNLWILKWGASVRSSSPYGSRGIRTRIFIAINGRF